MKKSFVSLVLIFTVFIILLRRYKINQLYTISIPSHYIVTKIIIRTSLFLKFSLPPAGPKIVLAPLRSEEIHTNYMLALAQGPKQS